MSTSLTGIDKVKHKVLAVLLASTLAACGSDPVNPPAELQDFEPKVYIKRLWKQSIGDGDNALDLDLQLVAEAGQVTSIDALGYIERLDLATGKSTADAEVDERVLSGLAQDDKHLYYTNFQGELIALDKQSFEQHWRSELSGEAVAAPSSDGQIVLVQTINGSLHAFDVASGAQLWRYDSVEPVLSLRGTAQPQITDTGSVISSFANGSMVSLALRTGELQWKQQLSKAKGRTELERLVDADGSPIIAGSVVYGVGFQGDIAAIDLRSGSELWTRAGSSYRGLAVDQKHVYASLDDGSVVALNRQNSSPVWTNSELSYRRLSSPVVSGELLFVSDFEGYLHVLSSANGELLARVRPDSDGIMGQPIVGQYVFYVYTNDGHLVAYQLYR